MPGRIPQTFIDDLLERTDLVAVVQRYVPLKRSGSEFAACCPFHGEKTPSFYVSPRKQFYHCFGCGAHGTAIGFLMEHENLEFTEAVAQLAEWAGVDVPRDAAGPVIDAAAPLIAALEAAARYYAEQLRSTPAAIDYLKGRGIDGSTARDFGIGWAPPGPDTLIRALAGQHQREDLVRAGLAARRDDGSLRDRFRTRIMFPLRDRRGRVIGFGGRLIHPGEPKYLNSPESPVFHKGSTIYGLFEARRAETRLDELVVTEGYMDVVGLAQAGFRRAVACMGTALTRDHFDLLFRQVSRLVLCFDGDDAGRRAAWRAVEQALPLMQGMREIRVLFLPEGDDPDSLVRRDGLEGWLRQLQAGNVLSETLMRLLAEQHPLDTAEGRSRFAHAAVRLVRTVSDPLLRGQLCDLVAERTDTPRARIEALLGEPPSGPDPPRARPGPSPERDRAATGTRQLWSALLARIVQRPQAAWDTSELRQLAATGTPAGEILEAILARIAAHPGITTARLLEHFRDQPVFARLSLLAAVPVEGEDAELSRRIALDSADRLLIEHCRNRIRTLSAADRALDTEEIDELRRLQTTLAQAGRSGGRP